MGGHHGCTAPFQVILCTYDSLLLHLCFMCVDLLNYRLMLPGLITIGSNLVYQREVAGV